VDELLSLVIAAAAPPVSVREDITETLHGVIVASRFTAEDRRLRLGRRWCLGLSAVVVVLGAGLGVVDSTRVLGGAQHAVIVKRSSADLASALAGCVCMAATTVPRPPIARHSRKQHELGTRSTSESQLRWPTGVFGKVRVSAPFFLAASGAYPPEARRSPEDPSTIDSPWLRAVVLAVHGHQVRVSGHCHLVAAPPATCVRSKR
jgi:hypothetical protein